MGQSLMRSGRGLWLIFWLNAFLFGAGESGEVRTFPTTGRLRFELTEALDHPLYWWPRTLLSYPVRFERAKIKPGTLTLAGSDSKGPLPFQLSGVKMRDGYLEFAFVNFFADLPTAGHRVFELSAEGAESAALSPLKPVVESRAGNTITLDTGAIKVRIPGSQRVEGEAPGPILQISRGGAWFGQSRIMSAKRKPLAISTSRIEAGPLFITYQVRYAFDGGSSYTAIIRAVTGYDFVSLFEEIEGISKDDAAHVETSWNNFHPTHRQAPNHPYYPRLPNNGKRGFERFDFEKIGQNFVNTQHGVTAAAGGEMPFRLGIYEPWGAYVILNSANFWDEKTGDATGVFIDRTDQWQDHDYSIWSASPSLQVRYFYDKDLMSWRWPLVTGTRSTCIAAYDHRKDIEQVDRLEKLSKPEAHTDGVKYPSELFPASYTLFLQNRYGLLDLNVVKDWVLEYGSDKKRAPVIFHTGAIQSAAELERIVTQNGLMRGLPVSGTRQNAGYNPVESRNIYSSWVDAYNRLYPQMTERQRRRLTAWFLMMAYVDAGDEMMPMRTMLSGHPNFLSDIKNVPALMAFLFPEHPMAQEWADEFGTFVALNARYHTRPAVQAWESKGGRWTENLGTYVWAALRPTSRTDLVLERYFDGKNRLAVPEMAEMGDWMVNALSAPFNGEDPKYSMGPDGKLPRHAWGLVTPELGPRRLHPPQGAHSARRMGPRTMWLFGNILADYRPLLAEHLMWAARPNDDDMEHFKDEVDAWSILFPAKDNRGTNPHLKSSKYTGYGITLRSAVDTADEVSIHVQQIDEGPNYRWGVAGEGGNGVLYYYARGKSYSHNGREDVGDRAAHDTDFCSNFAVWKNGQFRSIGRNVLERPLYDLGTAQLAELTPRQGPGAYSWPEYVSRSVLLAGSDYIVTYDHVFNDAVAHRFSWFTQAGDEMPFITMVKGGVREGQRLTTKLDTGNTKGIWYDGMGDALAVITHKPGVEVRATPYGAQVQQSGGTDFVFSNPEGIDYSSGGTIFQGTFGFIRKPASGAWDITLFHGSRIAAGGLELAVDDRDLGVNAVFQDPSEISGVSFARKGGALRLTTPASALFYIDGAAQSFRQEAGAIVVQLPAGKHRWQFTSGDPFPDAPRIARTENVSGGARIVVQPVASATRYRCELSRDDGKTWTPAQAMLSGLPNGAKVHIRAIAANASRQSEPGPEYPVYITSDPPGPPAGLKLHLSTGEVSCTWGEVLGASEYRLYRRVRGQSKFAMVYDGPEQRFTDRVTGVIPAFAQPGREANQFYEGPPYQVYEYAVAAVSGNGEGRKSAQSDTDPAGWANWDPKPGEHFRRRVVHATSDNREGMGSYYPE